MRRAPRRRSAPTRAKIYERYVESGEAGRDFSGIISQVRRDK